jgi:hypothetical protein
MTPVVNGAPVPYADALGVALELILAGVSVAKAVGVLLVFIVECDAWGNDSTDNKRIAKTAK